MNQDSRQWHDAALIVVDVAETGFGEENSFSSRLDRLTGKILSTARVSGACGGSKGDAPARGDFTGLEASGEGQTLVDNIAAFEKQYGYDGVDVDWEYPETNGDRAFLVELMSRLRKSNPDYVLSIDAAPWGGSGYDLNHLKLSLDYVNIMMYDCAGPWTAQQTFF